ncbi:MAG: glucose 1-dehydrogenase [Acidimicrobiales bacterium]|nr:glucose 1-dehydrogenase [Acidimicrobiales bacterium]
MLDRVEVEALHDLTGRVALVTGGSRGIGLAVACAFAAQGARVVVSSRRSEACDEAVASIRSSGGEATAVPAHIGRLEDLERLVAATVGAYGGIDILVNNAANPLALPIGSITEDAYLKSFDVNVRGPLFLFQSCLEHLLVSDHAAVVNVISAAAFLSTPGAALYGAAKAALLHFTRSMAAEYATAGIRVNALAPGPTDTTMVRNIGEAGAMSMAQSTRLGRLADADEMVGAVLYMASDASSFMTGQCITVDGGLVPAR